MIAHVYYLETMIKETKATISNFIKILRHNQIIFNYIRDKT